ncbi:lysophospholipase L2 [Variibacter gotjawalensis]|uniref:Lysophospholipase L2 n=2 Tax=Variibacter gotjawalensis TaxID=1333996 RepID=A0A0S3PQE3_9BRAD|nr:alpha/beta fold hydrolase [Variibacter gotjawalensis]NIK48438.1 pimeloyl-ACP methyl ester carboxylesterase [Variibacter gotjawalensis]RZS50305.1 alpha-beta hydrolase superfamily lysophospholipase [Variibacter gotjawalensis]BAT58138.1 lysophospholipase L2 [Variibacter gotjawalensis]
MRLTAIALSLAALAFAGTASAQTTKLVTEEMMVPSTDAGIELYVRNKRPADMTTFRPERTIVFVHGATYPAHTAFDLPLGGMSWMDYIASRGYDVYLLDIRGYGKSTRPKEMDEEATKNPPIARGDTAVKDIGSVVDFVLKRRNIQRTNLLGWSWGTTLMATYASQNQAKVERLALFAPAWIRTTPSLVQAGAGPTPAYRTVRKDQALDRWMTGVPEDKKADLIPAGWFDQWATATWATDPKGGGTTLRAPNGVVQDGLEFTGAGKAYFDPSKITAPTLLILAEWDRDTPPYMAQTLFPLLTNSPGKRLVMLAEGTHTIIMEKNRLKLFEAVQAFFDEAGRS